MDYPFWDVDIGYGLLMPIIAVIHVFVSHFAIGGGLYLVVAEHCARRASDVARLEFLKRLSRFFVLVSVVFGALTGVGIWFIIGLLSPAATEQLINSYVWAWATEWTFFAIEILASLLYFYGWRTMSARSHLIIGWIYFGAAWMSLFVINGIITFMLTPGDWLSTGNFWDGFFNPTFWSSLVFRTGVCIMLAGLYSQLVASIEKQGDFRNRTIRSSALWGLSGLVIATLSFIWYRSDIPGDQLAAAAERFSMPFTAIDQMYLYAALLAVGFVVFGLAIPRALRIGVAVVLMAVGLAWFGAYEWFRESVRKPFVITDYMYANGLRTADIDSYSDDGLLAAITFRTQDDGADLYRHLCRSCHTISGYRALKPALDGTDEEFIAAVVRGVEVTKGIMPPFPGTEEESRLLASHIYGQIDNRHIADIYGLEGVELGRKVYEVRCGLCHVVGGYNDKSESLVGLEEEDYHDLLDMAEDFGEEMPAFTGDDREREALVTYLMSLEAGGEMNPIEYSSLPAPLWLITILHILTLTLHLLAMNVVVGGIVVGLFGRFTNRWQHPFVTQLVKLLPTVMAATVTLGVAPLLFVQLVYGRLIYSASIISGWYWLMIFVAAIIGYYCLYAVAFGKKNKGRTGVYLGSALVCFLYISYVYSSVFSLSERPDLQAILYATNQSGLVLNSDIGSYLFRWLHVIVGAVTVGGFFVAVLGRHDGEAFATGKRFFLWGMIVATVLGIVYLMTFGEYLLPYMRSAAVWWMLVSALLSLGSIHFFFKRRFVVSGIMLFVSVLGMVINRHIVRLLRLEDHFDPCQLAVDSQWSALAVFLVCFVLAVFLIVYMLRLYFGRQSKPAAK